MINPANKLFLDQRRKFMKTLANFFATAMIVSMLTACGNNSSAPTENSTSTAEPTAQTTASPTPGINDGSDRADSNASKDMDNAGKDLGNAVENAGDTVKDVGDAAGNTVKGVTDAVTGN